MTVKFSDIVSDMPDKIYSFGDLDGSDSSLEESATITQEIIGAHLILNGSPDLEGISFLLEDGSFLRVGLDQVYTPNEADHVKFTSRLIGFSAKFGLSPSTSLYFPGYMGFITDTVSCEEAVFQTVTPFENMTVDISSGILVSQTKTIELSTVWDVNCSYSYSISPVESWLTLSSPSSNSIQIDVTSSDTSLIGTTTTLTMTLTPDYKDS